mgnify:FL=1
MNITFSKKNILGLRLFLLSSLLAATFAVFVFFHIFLPVDRISHTSFPFHIERGQGSYQIAGNLEHAGLIRSRAVFTLYAYLTGRAFKLQSGDYVLTSSLSAHAILGKLVAGDIVKETLTIIEGWNVTEINQYLASKGLAIELSSKEEGYLFPDTYYVPRAISAPELTKLMKANFEKKVGTIRSSDLIMASLLEKEVQTFEDKQIVSGILWKRLKAKIPLQVDAAPETYKSTGLPPGPIANPGLESIRAALEPEESPYWFYLSAPDGKTIFSRNFEEHKSAKAQYLQ